MDPVGPAGPAVGAADEAAERLAELEPCEPVVIARGAGLAQLRRAARFVENIGARPRHAVEHDQAQRAARHVDAVEIDPAIVEDVILGCAITTVLADGEVAKDQAPS